MHRLDDVLSQTKLTWPVNLVNRFDDIIKKFIGKTSFKMYSTFRFTTKHAHATNTFCLKPHVALQMKNL